MEPSRGIKLKINIDKEKEKELINDEILKGKEAVKENEEDTMIHKNDKDGVNSLLERRDSFTSEKNEGKDPCGDDFSNASDKKIKEKSFEKVVESLISKLTKMTCICENQNNNFNNSENNNNDIGKTCKKLVKQMYKYEKYLLNLNSYINDKNKNNNIDDITFPLGMIKFIDDYKSAEVWIYKYLLLEYKKYNDKYRNLIQNIGAFDATLKSKIVNEQIHDISLPIYAKVADEKLQLISENETNYYKNVHIPKDLAPFYLNEVKRRKSEK